MVVFVFHIRIPMDAWRQMIRHRTANVNEYSTRYSEAIDSTQTTERNAWRLQSKNSKQGSAGTVTAWPEHFVFDKTTGQIVDISREYTPRDYTRDIPVSPGDYLSQLEDTLQHQARNVYEERLSLGVAREQARKDLPLSTYTEAYWKIDLHNLFHFLSLRMAGDAQQEIRTYASAIGALVKPLVPMCWEAFEDYKPHAMKLSRLEVEYIRQMMLGETPNVEMGKREREELSAKLGHMGIMEQQAAAEAA
jgi:thymidylate synthase (FAD)